jgi:hypothetical protein
MTLTPEKQKCLLIALGCVLALLLVYRFVTYEQPKTASLTYTRGAIAISSVRPGVSSQTTAADPLNAFLLRKEERYSGVSRDIFRMQNAAPKPKRTLASGGTPTVPLVPIKTPEELAAELARTDLAQYKFLGSMTALESSVLLSDGRETFIVKKGAIVKKSYMVKETAKEYVVLLDTVSRVEVMVMLSGGEQNLQQQTQQLEQEQSAPQQQPAWQPRPRRPQ